MSEPLFSPSLARPAPARRWLWSVLLVIAVVLPTLIALEVLLLQQVGSRSRTAEVLPANEAAAGQSKQPSLAATATPATTAPSTAPVSLPATTTAPLRTPLPQQTKPTLPKEPAALSTPAVSGELRGALGGLTASHLSQAHLSIGLIADAVEKDVYSAAHGGDLLGTITVLISSVGKRLESLPPGTLPADEQKQLQRARAVNGLLGKQVEQLRRYWASGSREHADGFKKARKETWAELQALLGVRRQP
jgi:hypothetical protein